MTLPPPVEDAQGNAIVDDALYLLLGRSDVPAGASLAGATEGIVRRAGRPERFGDGQVLPYAILAAALADLADVIADLAAHIASTTAHGATAVPTANRIAMWDAGAKIALAGLQEVLGLLDLTDVTAKTGGGTTVVMQDSPVLTTPTIADHTNAQHDHESAAGGGTLDAAAVVSGQFPIARLASGVPDGTKFIRDDGTLVNPGAAAGGTVGTAVLDFGSTPTDEATVVVTGQATIVAGSTVQAFFMRESTADNDVDEHLMASALCALTCGNIVAGTGFTIYAKTDLQATGTFNVRWFWK